MNASTPSSLSQSSKPFTRGLSQRSRHDTDSEDDDEAVSASVAQLPWLSEFDRYIKTVEAVDADVDIVNWWGVCVYTLSLNSLTHSEFLLA